MMVGTTAKSKHQGLSSVSESNSEDYSLLEDLLIWRAFLLAAEGETTRNSPQTTRNSPHSDKFKKKIYVYYLKKLHQETVNPLYEEEGIVCPLELRE
eukprot:CAMPEP_0194250818 /NCGR_PEP_ID=MMETSP0158-20130606/24002_1 /TAXON_ID=33649 /ORGANISM="Thalassionema nitzschioides, Strain L26-B" /LENGTH=96 /DNA_ID=CAMNT_0038987753 /DNA_START=21 /DNA_END=308 /DNA_ORIENTATION=+